RRTQKTREREKPQKKRRWRSMPPMFSSPRMIFWTRNSRTFLGLPRLTQKRPT
ncbi:hypothetical protein C0989_001903, partial [Termitomyces sp. Mn162]